ncbi:MAG: hypothetical protein AABO58_10100 [Acidobacteriota bacterium]
MVIEGRLKSHIESLIDVLLPLQDWIKKKAFKPAQPVPWREPNAKPLNAKNLGVVDSLNALIAESDDADLLARFTAHAANPLARSPLPDVAAWRAARRLDPQPVFAIVRSENIYRDAVTREAIARSTFYDINLRLFDAAAGTAAPGTPAQWMSFADALRNDTSSVWSDATHKSSVFVRQLLKDVLTVLLNMRTSQPSPWREALPIELGEARRPGNKFEPKDAKDATEAFAKLLDEVAKSGKVSATDVPPPPAGSPPATTKPKHYS